MAEEEMSATDAQAMVDAFLHIPSDKEQGPSQPTSQSAPTTPAQRRVLRNEIRQFIDSSRRFRESRLSTSPSIPSKRKTPDSTSESPIPDSDPVLDALNALGQRMDTLQDYVLLCLQELHQMLTSHIATTNHEIAEIYSLIRSSNQGGNVDHTRDKGKEKIGDRTTDITSEEIKSGSGYVNDGDDEVDQNMKLALKESRAEAWMVWMRNQSLTTFKGESSSTPVVLIPDQAPAEETVAEEFETAQEPTNEDTNEAASKGEFVGTING